MSTVNIPALRFALAIVGHTLRGGFSFHGGHLPPVNHTIKDGFAGVGVAASEDPAVDAYLIARLREAGIRFIRLDFSYGDQERPAGRLLEALCAADFRVVLHLIQPLQRARCMATASESDSSSARAEWQHFVATTLDQHGHQIDMVEVGSTINRRRWSGYTLPGFLSMWDVAWQEVRQRGLTLAGPSVTDFEPPWNVGLLSLLRRQGQLPDVHTDNLFSERCTEPERYDHKILGHRLTPLHKFNLIKKARLLARIGTDFGVPRLFSPSAFWTLPRIERMLPDSEEKQADYLSRYMVLCAASGALERAWWGPLICHREGLIDNGKRPYPALERITHYASAEGNLADLRLRPAFAAMRTFVQMITGTQYEGRQNASSGLEVHSFRSSKQLVHAVWAINGRAAALDDIYAPEDLLAATFINRDGIPDAGHATLVGEAPRYLVWAAPREVSLKAGAALLPDVAIALHLPNKQHFIFRDNGWQGIILARDANEAAQLLQTIHPDRIASPPGDTTLRHARNAIWTIADPRCDGARLVIKQPVRMHLHKKLLDRFKPSKALRSWNGTNELLRRGIEAASPVAYFEKCGDTTLTQNYYLCEYVTAKFTARDLVASFARGETLFEGVIEENAYRQLSSYLLTMHGRGILFRDLSGGNILIDVQDNDRLGFSLIDTGRLHAFQHPLSLSQRFADLVRICNKMRPEGREKFLRLYLSAIGQRLRWWHHIHFFAYDMKVSAKRHVGRKALKRIFSPSVR